MDLVFALIAAALVVGGVAFAVARSDRLGMGSRSVSLGAGVAVGIAAAIVFLVPQIDLVPDELDGAADILILIASGAAIAGLGWPRIRPG